MCVHVLYDFNVITLYTHIDESITEKKTNNTIMQYIHALNEFKYKTH